MLFVKIQVKRKSGNILSKLQIYYFIGILVVNKGECMTDKCSKPCSRLYDPVCTVDSKRNSRTHDNWCLFEIALCENPGEREL